MTVFTLAVKNLRHHARDYVSFFLSSSFAIWLFYLYATLTMHPDFKAELLTDLVYRMLVAVQSMVGLFSALFILYAHSAFLKGRQKDLALLTLLGMHPREVAQTIHYETGLVGLVAIGTGIGTGLLCSKVFFLGIGRVLGLANSIPFYFSWYSLVLTLLVFGTIFFAVSVYGQRHLTRLPLAELIRGAFKPKSPPRFSWWLVCLCFICLGTAYVILYTLPPTSALPLLALTFLLLLIGNYLLFTQGSVAALTAVAGSPLYYRGTNLFTVSQLVYKIKDNARILFMVSMLLAIVIESVGSTFAGYRSAGNQSAAMSPISIMLLGKPAGLDSNQVSRIVQEHGLRIAGTAEVEVLLANLNQGSMNTESTVISISSFNQWLSLTNQPLLLLEPDKTVLIVYSMLPTAGISKVRLTFGNQTVELPVDQEYQTIAFNSHRQLWRVLVVDDQRFAELQTQFDRYVSSISGVALENWQDSSQAITQLEEQVGAAARQESGPLSSTLRAVQSTKQVQATLFFLACFIGLLFFLASGNMLYFKLFTDIQADRQQFKALYKLGLSKPEAQRIASTQAFALFFVPFAVGLVHALFILSSMRREHLVIWPSVALVTITCLILYAGYYLVTRRTYLRALLNHN